MMNGMALTCRTQEGTKFSKVRQSLFKSIFIVRIIVSLVTGLWKKVGLELKKIHTAVRGREDSTAVCIAHMGFE